jgi:CheY-like chemotaxis protein
VINHSASLDSSQFNSTRAARLERGLAWHMRAPKILCVEDDRETAALIFEELVERGFEVRIAHNGQEGLLAILQEKVLCNISMPITTAGTFDCGRTPARTFGS